MANKRRRVHTTTHTLPFCRLNRSFRDPHPNMASAITAWSRRRNIASERIWMLTTIPALPFLIHRHPEYSFITYFSPLRLIIEERRTMRPAQPSHDSIFLPASQDSLYPPIKPIMLVGNSTNIQRKPFKNRVSGL